jgi:hypothetical protein
MGRKSNEEMKILESMIKKIVEEHPEASSTEVAKILQDEYGKDISKPTLLGMMSHFKAKMDSSDDLELEYEDHPEIVRINERIATLEKDFKGADNISDRCKISGQLDSAQKTKMDIKLKIQTAKIEKMKSYQAKYIITFGEPTVVKNIKPVFQAGDGQSTIDEHAKEGSEKSE